MKFRNLSLRDKVRLVLAITALIAGIYEVDREMTADLFSPRTIFIDNAKASGSVLLVSSLGENTSNPAPEIGRSANEVEHAEVKLVDKTKSNLLQPDLIKKISAKYGVDWKMVYAVCLNESGCKIPDCGAVRGNCDNNRSMGYYQINKDAHPDITEAQANDLEWSTEWTIKHAIQYKDNSDLFYKAHNGIGKTTNQWYIDNCKKIYASL